MSITKRVATVVNRKRTSQKELAEAMNVSKQYVSGLLTGRNSIGLKSIKSILDYYDDLNANWLIKGTGSMFINEEKLLKVEEELADYNNVKTKYYELLEENRKLRIEIEGLLKKRNT